MRHLILSEFQLVKQALDTQISYTLSTTANHTQDFKDCL